MRGSLKVEAVGGGEFVGVDVGRVGQSEAIDHDAQLRREFEEGKHWVRLVRCCVKEGSLIDDGWSAERSCWSSV